MSSLNVPLIFQEDDFSCTPVCIKMVLEYLRSRYPEGIPNLDVSAVAKAIKTSADDGGTTFENIKGLNEELVKALPSLEFVAGSGYMFEEIEEELKASRPVIAWITMTSPQGPFHHSIVVTGIDRDRLLIYCNDPVYGKETIPIREFMNMWEDSFRILIKAEIGERRQRFIREFMEKGENIEGR
jgi:hypothetical protein